MGKSAIGIIAATVAAIWGCPHTIGGTPIYIEPRSAAPASGVSETDREAIDAVGAAAAEVGLTCRPIQSRTFYACGFGYSGDHVADHVLVGLAREGGRRVVRIVADDHRVICSAYSTLIRVLRARLGDARVHGSTPEWCSRPDGSPHSGVGVNTGVFSGRGS